MHPLARRLAVALSIGLLIVLADYLASNWLGHWFDDSSLLTAASKLLPMREDEGLGDEFLCLNIGYDKQLAAVRDEMGDSIGCVAVTDRRVLRKLLEIARQADYKHMFVDVRFEQGCSTPLDSLLFADILSMPRLVISHHGPAHGYVIADSALLPKAALADFKSTYFSGFSAYEYLQGDSASVALRIYRDLDGKDLRRIGPLFFSGWRLCHNMHFLTFGPDDLAGNKFPAFGSEYLQMLSESEIAALMKGRIVVVGNFADDVHATYYGDVPGPVLTMKAYAELRRGGHLASPLLGLLLVAVYSACAFLILYIHTLPLPPRLTALARRLRPLAFALILLGWGCALTALKVAVFLMFKKSIIISIPSLVFSLLSMPSDYKSFAKQMP